MSAAQGTALHPLRREMETNGSSKRQPFDRLQPAECSAAQSPPSDAHSPRRSPTDPRHPRTRLMHSHRPCPHSAAAVIAGARGGCEAGTRIAEAACVDGIAHACSLFALRTRSSPLSSRSHHERQQQQQQQRRAVRRRLLAAVRPHGSSPCSSGSKSSPWRLSRGAPCRRGCCTRGFEQRWLPREARPSWHEIGTPCFG